MEEFRPPSVVQEDTELAIAFRAADEAAVRQLWERYGALVFAVALRIVGDRGRAEEVTQHTFLQAWRNSDRFQPGRDFAPWLTTIACRAAIDAQRIDRRRPADPIGSAPPDDSDLVSPAPSAEQIETVWAVRAAIEQLDSDEREIVRLQHLEGCSHRQIAERLELTVGTVTSRSHRAHRRLARRLGHLRDEASTGDPPGDLS